MWRRKLKDWVYSQSKPQAASRVGNEFRWVFSIFLPFILDFDCGLPKDFRVLH
jgi:hypothetical protein